MKASGYARQLFVLCQQSHEHQKNKVYVLEYMWNTVKCLRQMNQDAEFKWFVKF